MESGGEDRAEAAPGRCFWAPEGDEAYVAYHDEEWGFPVTEDSRLFEKLSLEGFQSGLSWRTILRKRENFRAAFVGFDIEGVAKFGDDDVARLLQDAGIVRHRGKIEATINNARQACRLVEEVGSLAAYFWSFEPDPRTRPERITTEVVMGMATSPESVALSKDLKKRGWRFVGPTTVYAFMQAMGMVNDHTWDCSIRGAVENARREFPRPG
jgi:DNA-3-methyladenine glycosylase I